VPNWGSQWKAFVKENADRWNNSYIQKSTLPYEDNFLDLDPVVKDPLGSPVCLSIEPTIPGSASPTATSLVCASRPPAGRRLRSACWTPIVAQPGS
jgi:hypothetical protein